MKPNVEIRNGRFEVMVDLKVGSLLLHNDWPLGLAMHDMKKGDEIKYDANENTEDVATEEPWPLPVDADKEECANE